MNSKIPNELEKELNDIIKDLKSDNVNERIYAAIRLRLRADIAKKLYWHL